MKRISPNSSLKFSVTLLVALSLGSYYVFFPLIFDGLSVFYRKRALNSKLLEPGWKEIYVYSGKLQYGHPRLWNSQVAQDKKIADLFQNKRNGFFVDLAANDAVALSNTVALENNLEWRGLCIEANSRYMWGLAHRKCDVVYAVVWNETDATVEFEMSNEFGGIVSNMTDNERGLVSAKFATITLEDIFEKMNAPAVIDYFSLDIEGAELFAMKQFPFSKYKFLAITVERPDDELMTILDGNGYMYLADHGWFGDKLFIHKTIPNFDHIMAKYHLKNPCSTVADDCFAF